MKVTSNEVFLSRCEKGIQKSTGLVRAFLHGSLKSPRSRYRPMHCVMLFFNNRELQLIANMHWLGIWIISKFCMPRFPYHLKGSNSRFMLRRGQLPTMEFRRGKMKAWNSPRKLIYPYLTIEDFFHSYSFSATFLIGYSSHTFILKKKAAPY